MQGRNFPIFVTFLLCLIGNGLFSQNTTVNVKLKILLQGCYNSADGQMSVNLRTGNYLPLTSPYCEDLRSVASIPTDISDWVLVQLRSTADGAAVASKSAMLRRDGRIVADDGTTTIAMNAIPGSYYIVIKHRNHLPVMTASMITLSSDTATLYDFTISENKCYGTSGVVEVETGIWAMWAGDINQDGMVTTRDYKIWYEINSAGVTGYLQTDINRDGLVNIQDYSVWLYNATKGAKSASHTTMEDVEICLSPNALDFGIVAIGLFSDKNITITNTCTATLQVSNLSTTNADFSIIGSTSFNIVPGGCHDVLVRYAPSIAINYNSVLRIYNNSEVTVMDVALSGIGCETGIITDIDGNSYKIIKLGSQWWMAENLKVTHYRNGEPIPNVTDNSEWLNLTTGAYCHYNNDETIAITYGRLYNWHAVSDNRNLAPAGWHVPSDAEWKQIEKYLGMSDSEISRTGRRGTDEGGKLKEIGTTHWASPNEGATNLSLFTALPAGARNYGVVFNELSLESFFWTTDQYNNYDAWNRILTYNSASIYRYYGNGKWLGYSIRCVKD